MPPDWHKQEDYVFTEVLSDEEWAWEFLRRNPAYREDYKAASFLLEMLEQFYGPLDNPEVIRKLQVAPGAYHFKPPRNENESVCEWDKRCRNEGAEPIMRRVDDHLGWKWGIDGPIQNPFTEDRITPNFWTTPDWPRLITQDESSNYFDNKNYLSGPQFVLVGFNLNLNVKKQASDIGRVLARDKKRLKSAGLINRLPNTRDTKYLKDHLRLLDADLAGAETGEIGKHIFGKESKTADGIKQQNDYVYDRRKAAERYRDHDYRLLPLRKLKS